MLRWLARAALLGVRADEACAFRIDGDGFRLVHCTGPHAREAELWQERAGRGPARTAAAYGRVVTIRDWETEGADLGVRVRALLGGLRSVTAVPLSTWGRAAAVIDLWWLRPGSRTAAQQAAIAHLRSIAGAEMEIAAQREAAWAQAHASLGLPV